MSSRSTSRAGSAAAAAPPPLCHPSLPAALAQGGDAGPAAEHAREVLRRDPGFTIDAYVATLHYKNEADRAPPREALAKAGLPLQASVAS